VKKRQRRLTQVDEIVLSLYAKGLTSGEISAHRHCTIHLIRNTFRLTSRADHNAINHDIKPIYTAPTPDATLAALDELEENWGGSIEQ
jgi:transposase-like protein